MFEDGYPVHSAAEGRTWYLTIQGESGVRTSAAACGAQASILLQEWIVIDVLLYINCSTIFLFLSFTR